MSDANNASDSPLAGFGKFVPGFDFLQNLATQAAGSAAQKMPQMPNLGSWVAPTLNVEELDKRIQELKAVQFWLDQNAVALKATIQALEVQKMTLATLKGMNFNMGDVANAFKLKVADSLAGGVQQVANKARTFSGLEVPPSRFQAEHDSQADAEPTETPEPEAPRAPLDKPRAAKGKAAKAPASGVVDPMQWWGALTQQFQTIATDALKDAAKKTAIDTTKSLATGLAKDAMKSATGMAKGMASSAGKTVAGGARAAMNTATTSLLNSRQAWPTPTAKGVKSTAAAASPTRAKPKPKPARKTAR